MIHSSWVAFADHEVPASCVEMSTVARLVDYSNRSSEEYISDCFNMGGNHSYNYERHATYIGVCSDRLPCEAMSSDNTKIYQYTC